MSAVAGLAARSVWNRRGTAALTIFTIAVSVALLLGVQKIRVEAKASFANTISGTDLIVGARSGPINLLLYAIFRVGDATANVSYATYRTVAAHPDVAWTIPISLGDSHHGFRVMGTSSDYFAHYHFAGDHVLAFEQGGPFSDLYDAVLGAEVADSLHYRLGDTIIVSHGLGNVSFANHKDKPFRVAGILKRTGTPVDRTVHVSLEAITAIHIDWQSGTQAPLDGRVSADEARRRDLTPDSITAFLVGMKSKSTVFTMQRALNEYRKEPLLAIIPGVALTQLWDLVGVADTALLIVAAFVVTAGLLGMLTAILTSLAERRREMAILRSVGARPRDIFLLLVAEAGLLGTLGALIGVLLTYAVVFAGRHWLEQRYGLFIGVGPPSTIEFALLGGVIVAAFAVGAIPALRAYGTSLADGLTIRV
ncbi:MAG TPA: FtsX-like permease family protein [Gemmatimonadaceae bacterium]|nr:FtsX-like permease family protein [Gemmatimonadaceae bacterium]